MSQPTVRIRISPNGDRVIVEAHGCPGPTCERLTRPIEEALGRVVEATPTVEYFETPSHGVDAVVEGGAA